MFDRSSPSIWLPLIGNMCVDLPWNFTLQFAFFLIHLLSYTYIIIGLLAFVGNLIVYAMRVRWYFVFYYSHSWETVPQTPSVAVMCAYGSPHHSEIWLPTLFSISPSIYLSSNCLPQHYTTNMCMLWNQILFPRNISFLLHFQHWNVLLYGINDVRSLRDFTMIV